MVGSDLPILRKSIRELLEQHFPKYIPRYVSLFKMLLKKRVYCQNDGEILYAIVLFSGIHNVHYHTEASKKSRSKIHQCNLF